MKILTRHKPWLESLSIFCCGLFLFTVGLSQQEIIGFESRFYLFALEMWRHGVSWFPTTYGSFYPDYPVTATLMIYGVAKLLGGLNKFSAVLPSAIAAAITLTVTFRIGALHARRWGWFAVFFMLLTNMFVMEARTISPDQYVAMVTTLSFYLIYSAKLTHQYKRLGWLPVLFAVGFAFRGPIGLIIPAGVVCVFYLLEKNIKYFLLAGFTAFLVLVAGASVLFAAAYHVGGMTFVQDVLRMQVSTRLHDAVLPWYFYFYESLGAYALSYPVAILVALGLRARDRSAEQELMLKLMGWALVILIGLSIPSGKKIRYILAFVPALALMSGYIFAFPRLTKYFIWLREILALVLNYFPVLCLLAVALVTYLALHKNFVLPVAYLPLLFVFGILQLLSLIYRKNAIVTVGIAALTLMMVFIMIIEPLNLALNKTRQFVMQTEKFRHARHIGLAFYQENPDALPIKYVVNMPVEERPIFITSEDSLAQFKVPALIIVDPDRFTRLPSDIAMQFRVLDQGQVGRDNVMVLQRKE